MNTNVSHTPTDDGDANRLMSAVDNGAAMIAPPPNPMTARPVANPRW